MIFTLSWAAAGAASLILLYRHIQVNWPQSYFGPTESVSQYLSGSGARYMVFRFVPPYVIFVTVGLYAPGDHRAAIVTTLVLYAGWSTALSVHASLTDAPGSVRLSRARYLVLSSIVLGLGICAALATLTVPPLAPNAPPVADVVANLIAALIAAVVAISYFESTRSSGDASTTISADLEGQIRAISLDHGVDERLALAIAYVENLQRPPWFRRAEGVFWRLNRHGSFGLFQVRGHGPVSDVDSCRIAMRSLRDAYPVRDQYGSAAEWSVRQLAERHNPDAQFAEMVYRSYERLSARSIEETTERAPDNRPLLDVRFLGRFRETMSLRGTFWSNSEHVVVEVIRPTSPAPENVIPALVINSSGRSTWRAEFAAGATRVLVRSVSASDPCFTSSQLEINLQYAMVERDLTLR